MIQKNIRQVFRNLYRNKGLYSINIIGLAIGMMAFLFIFQYIRFEKSYDKYLDNANRLQRLVFYRDYKTGLDKSVGNNYFIGQLAYEKILGIENFCRCRKETQFIQSGEKIFKEERTFFADSSFFDLFSHPVLAGEKADFLRRPNVAIITESTALKYFGNDNPIGKTIYRVNPGMKPLLIQGVVKDVPQNSHLKFDVIISLSSLTDRSYCYACNNTNTYFLLREGTDPVKIATEIKVLAQEDFKSRNVNIDFPISYQLQPISDIHLHSNCRFEHETNGNNKYLSVLFIISIFILLSAWLNYFDLFASILVRRISGIGTKIINGASRKNIISEIATETMLMGSISLALGYILLFLLFPVFKEYLNLDFSISLISRVSDWLLPSSVILLTSLIIGILLGLKIYRIRPVQIMKKSILKIQGKNSQKIMLTGQFVVTIFLITSTILVMKQIDFMQQKTLVMDMEQTLVIRRPNEKQYNSPQIALQESLKKLTEIKEITFSNVIPGEKNNWVKGGITIMGREKFSDQIYQSDVAPGFFNFFRVKLLAGRQFFDDETNWQGGKRHLIVNKEAALAFGYDNFSEIIGKAVYDSDNTTDVGEVVGVVDGYFQNSLDQEIRPTIFNTDQYGYYIFLKIRSDNIKEVVSKVTIEYQKYFKGQYFEYFFLDDFFNSQYKSHIQFHRCFVLFSVMAIIIAILSLLGVVFMMSAARTKEIGIRKVNGARVSEILTLLNKDFVKWVVVAFIIACPIAYYAMNNWLQNFAYKTELSWWVFVSAGVIASLIALITVSWQSWRAASRNPVEALRYE